MINTNDMQQENQEKQVSLETLGKIAELRISRKYLEKTIVGYEFQWWIAISYLIAFSLIGYALSYFYKTNDTNIQILFIAIGGLIGFSCYSFVAFFVRQLTFKSLKEKEKELAQLGYTDIIEGLQQNPSFYDRLIQINFKYTDKYYSQTQEQADKSFKLAAFASISSFIIIIFGITQIYKSDINTSSYLTTIAGVLTSFVSAIFFYLYNQTVQKMSNYHKKLVLSQNINLALKLAQGIKDEVAKTEAIKTLIDRLTTDINKTPDEN